MKPTQNPFPSEKVAIECLINILSKQISPGAEMSVEQVRKDLRELYEGGLLRWAVNDAGTSFWLEILEDGRWERIKAHFIH